MTEAIKRELLAYRFGEDFEPFVEAVTRIIAKREEALMTMWVAERTQLNDKYDRAIAQMREREQLIAKLLNHKAGIDLSTMRATPTPFRCISTDPPWAENGSGKVKRGANRHYATMKTADIIDVHRRYFAEVGGPDPAGCLLWMWATSNHLLDAIEVMQALGFRYVTSMVWVKVTSTGKPHVGLGQRTRQRHELLLLGVMGKVAIPAPPDRPDSVIVAARGKHSEKPQDAYDRIQRACAGPRLEVFGRAAREGWTVVGNEAPK